MKLFYYNSLSGDHLLGKKAEAESLAFKFSLSKKYIHSLCLDPKMFVLIALRKNQIYEGIKKTFCFIHLKSKLTPSRKGNSNIKALN